MSQHRGADMGPSIAQLHFHWLYPIKTAQAQGQGAQADEKPAFLLLQSLDGLSLSFRADRAMLKKWLRAQCSSLLFGRLL